MLLWVQLSMPVLEFYERRLLNEVELTKQLSDIYWGTIEPCSITLEFSNADGFFTDLEKVEELRNKSIRFKIYEYMETPTVSFLVYGKIIDYNLTEKATFTVAIHDPESLDAIVPKKVYETTDWPETPPYIINPPYDLGKAYNICFGYCKKVPLLWVHADYTDNYYDYIIGYGIIESNDSNKATTVNVYRDKVLVDQSEYTVYDGSQSSPYPGFAFIRFIKEQIDFSGSPYELTADIRGLKPGGSTIGWGDAGWDGFAWETPDLATTNFAFIIRYLLTDTVWGLGLSVNAASFNTAAGEVDDIYCDGFISEQRKGIDVLNELLFCCHGRLNYNENGEFIIDIDTQKMKVYGTFGYGDGRYENIIEITENKKTPSDEAFKNFQLNYGWNQWENKYQYLNKREIFGFGEEKIYNCPFIQDHITADIITSYQKSCMLYGDKKLTIVVGMEGRNLTEGQLVKVIIQ